MSDLNRLRAYSAKFVFGVWGHLGAYAASTGLVYAERGWAGLFKMKTDQQSFGRCVNESVDREVAAVSWA